MRHTHRLQTPRAETSTRNIAYFDRIGKVIFQLDISLDRLEQTRYNCIAREAEDILVLSK